MKTHKRFHYISVPGERVNLVREVHLLKSIVSRVVHIYMKLIVDIHDTFSFGREREEGKE
jgi:hypothetical protein